MIKDSAQQIQILQILYEIAMSIGESLDLRKMLKASVSTFLKRLNCSAGGVYRFVEQTDKTYSLECVYAVPRNIEKNATYQIVLQQIPTRLKPGQLRVFLSSLTISGQADTGGYFHILELPNFGLLTLVKNGDDLDPFVVKSLQPLQGKLAAACNACLTEKTRIEEHNLLRTLVDNMPDYIFVKDRESRFMIANDATARMMGVDTPDRLSGKTDFDFHPAELAEQFYADEQAVITSGQALIGREEPCLDHVTGEGIWILTTKAPFWDSQGNIAGVVGMGRDITARKQAEEELAQYREHLEELVKERTSELMAAAVEAEHLNEQLRQEICERKRTEEELREAKEVAEEASRLKSEFLANMSHEIRTPMNAVLGFAQLLELSPIDPQQKDYLQAIKTGGENLLNLINDILDLSKIESKKMEITPQPTDLKSLVRKLLDIFQMNIAEKGLDVQVDIAPELPEQVLLDALRLRQVLFHLLGNAIKFTEEGKVTLRVSKLETRNSKLETSQATSSVSDDQFQVSSFKFQVEDTGIGIPDDQQELIFDAFRQQDGQSTRRYGGTGLGLAITKRLVDLMGGHLTLTSTVGQGSRFEIILPQVPIVPTPPTAHGKEEAPSVPEIQTVPSAQNARAIRATALPLELLAALKQAAIHGDMDVITSMINTLRSHNAAFADVLEALANEFDYGTIIQLIQDTESD